MSKAFKRWLKRSARRRLRGSRAGARGRWLDISTFLRPPSTAFCGSIIYSLIGCGPLPLVSPDPQFGEKLLEVVALFMNPPDNVVVLCMDEKTGIQALDRTQPMLPQRATKPRSWTNEYVRHGTRTLLASLDIGTGRVIAHVRKRRTSKDFLAFLDSVVKEYPDQRLAIVLDNLNTHTNEAARIWLENHQLVSFHYTPTHASWVNLIECFFSILTRQGLQQAVHQSGRELEYFLKSFIQEYNKRCGPFEWTKGPEKLRRIIELTEQWQSQ